MGRKITFEITEDNIAAKLNPQCELSILIGVDSLSYCITDAQRKLILLRNNDLSPFQILGEFFLQDEFLRLSYQAVRVAIASPLFTLIPNRLYNIAEKKTYLQHVAPVNKDMDIRADELKSIAATNVYAVKQDTLDTVRKYLPGSKSFHVVTALVAGLLARNDLPNGPSLHLHVHEDRLFIILLDKKSLLFANLYLYQSAKDFLYYVMLIFEQFKLAPEEVPAYVSGQLVKDSEIFPLLQRYIFRLEFISMPDFIQASEKTKEHAHLYFDLFSVLQCN